LQVEWDVILRIIRNLLPYLVGHEDNEQYSLIPVVREILEVIHGTHHHHHHHRCSHLGVATPKGLGEWD
jgi:hypothetical protein